MRGQMSILRIFLFTLVVALLHASQGYADFTDKPACLSGNIKKCVDYGSTKGLSWDEAKIALELACDANDLEGCYILADSNSRRSEFGEAIEKFNKSIEIAKKLGQAGAVQLCHKKLGELYLRIDKTKQAMQFFNLACKEGDRESCENVSHCKAHNKATCGDLK